MLCKNGLHEKTAPGWCPACVNLSDRRRAIKTAQRRAMKQADCPLDETLRQRAHALMVGAIYDILHEEGVLLSGDRRKGVTSIIREITLQVWGLYEEAEEVRRVRAQGMDGLNREHHEGPHPSPKCVVRPLTERNSYEK